MIVFSLLVALVYPVFGENAFLAEVCAKCCPTAVHFNATFNQCHVNVTEPIESGSGGGNFLVCPVSSPVNELHFNVQENFDSSVEFQRAGQLSDECQSIPIVLFCPKTAKIFVTNCCEWQSLYNVTAQKCFKINSNESVPWPKVRSSTTNKLLNSAQDFQVTTHLIQCLNGSIRQTSTEFTLFDDGTVRIPNITTNFSPGEVCIVNSFDSKDFVALFCVSDPCASSSCVRKCCPEGFVMNSETHSCEAANIEFLVNYQNENGHNVTLPNNLPIRSGVIGKEGLDLRTGTRDTTWIVISVFNISVRHDHIFNFPYRHIRRLRNNSRISEHTVIKRSPFWGIKTPQNGLHKSGTLKTPQNGGFKTVSTVGDKNPPFWGIKIPTLGDRNLAFRVDIYIPKMHA